MTPKEKAQQLINKFDKQSSILQISKHNALFCVEEILNENLIYECDLSYKRAAYWEEVKQEIRLF